MMRRPDTTSTISSVPICVTIAGSDSSGGAGIQADLKAFSALKTYGASVITAITAQNTCGVSDVMDMTPSIIRGQMEAVFSDLKVDAVKIGMLSKAETIETVMEGLKYFQGPVVLDPVMVAKSGNRLLNETAIDVLSEKLIPLATLITPNRPEAACLLNMDEAKSDEEAEAQGRALLALGAKAVLMKGGHAEGEVCTDLLITPDQPTFVISAPRIHTKNTHGTGCTLSAALAAKLGYGLNLAKAFQEAHDYLHQAILAADQLKIGSGHGPVHHFYDLWAKPAQVAP
ncbi:bifunctional hydroxymethylpyrimidine kinase/phosphomethylpyrimidine kinase [Brucellaceae bacterium C25G]